MNKILFVLFFAVAHTHAAIILSGKILCSDTKKPLPDANIYILSSTIGTSSKINGTFTLKSTQHSGTLIITYIGYQTISKEFISDKDSLNFGTLYMKPEAIRSDSIQVEASREQNTASTFQMSPSSIRQMATALPDPLLALKSLPGVSSANDQSTLYNVRGGNFDENLICINGFEIYQPFLVRKGYMENPSLVNPYMIHSVNLTTGAFPVKYDDKLSSVLDINYKTDSEGWSAVSDMRTIGLFGTIGYQNKDKINFIIGGRGIDYGYLMSGNQLRGEYNPKYYDVQATVQYKLSSHITFEGIGLINNSQYKIIPEEWSYHTAKLGSYHLTYDNSHLNFDYKQSLYGARMTYQVNQYLKTSFQYSEFNQDETDESDMKAISRHLVKTGKADSTADSSFIYSNVDNILKARYKTLKSQTQFTWSKITSTFGIQYKQFALKNDIRNWDQIGDPMNEYYRPAETFTTSANYQEYLTNLFIHFLYSPVNTLIFEGGVRWFKNSLNNEQVIQPRMQFEYMLNTKSRLFLAIGRYAQPPISRELASAVDHGMLQSQKSNLYSVGIHSLFNRYEIKCEGFYKDQYDLISYDLDDVKLSYSGVNDSRGIIYGLDSYIRFDQTEQLTHWLSVSWLNARENIRNDGRGYIPMPTDRRLQISVYTEDQMDRWRNSKVHLRALFGTGYPYTGYLYQKIPNSNQIEKVLAPRNSSRIPFYTRFDVGYTQTFKLFGIYNVVLREEVLNMFEHCNTLDIEVTPWNDKIKYVMSQRIYNLGLSVDF